MMSYFHFRQVNMVRPKDVILFYILIMCGLCTKAQLAEETSRAFNNSGYILNDPGSLYHNINTIKELPVQGSPYLVNSFKPGQISIGIELFNSYFRYNAWKEVIEIKMGNDEILLLQKHDTITPKFDGKIYQYKSYYDVNGNLVEGYLNPLNQGNAVIYLKYKKEFVQGKLADNGYEIITNPYFKENQFYLIGMNDNKPKPIKLSPKILKYLNLKKAELKEYISKNQLNLRKEYDVIRLINHYNQITLNDK